MAKKEKAPNKKPSISSYWLYALIAAFFVGMSYFNNSDSMSERQQINISTFEKYLNDGDVAQVLVINKNVAHENLNFSNLISWTLVPLENASIE